jgi:hypothetical protein
MKQQQSKRRKHGVTEEAQAPYVGRLAPTRRLRSGRRMAPVLQQFHDDVGSPRET